QVNGGSGYSSEYLPEAWLRDQKLNSIHEGTTTIQGLDLLGRKAVAGGGAAMLALDGRVRESLAGAEAAGLDFARPLAHAMDALLRVTSTLGARGAAGDLMGMLGHSADYLELASTVVVGWAWVLLATRAARHRDDFSAGLTQAARYWLHTEVPRASHLAHLCEHHEASYLEVTAAQLEG
ncbi:MAG: acyl-CoA dehydrogenase, partial [Myxococcaceae bacterium]|nr:acyl-CoA dehydrogenase [Myxococcaceae bacterium]